MGKTAWPFGTAFYEGNVTEKKQALPEQTWNSWFILTTSWFSCNSLKDSRKTSECITTFTISTWVMVMHSRYKWKTIKWKSEFLMSLIINTDVHKMTGNKYRTAVKYWILYIYIFQHIVEKYLECGLHYTWLSYFSPDYPVINTVCLVQHFLTQFMTLLIKNMTVRLPPKCTWMLLCQRSKKTTNSLNLFG